MKLIILFSLFLSNMAFGFEFDNGVYARKINDGKYHCSWQISYDSKTKKMSFQAVNDIWNGFKCNADTSFTVDCIETEKDLTCIDRFSGDHRAKTTVLARVPFTVTIQDPYDISKDLGILVWRAEVPPTPSKYYGKDGKGWQFLPNVGAQCLLNPGIEYCESLADYQVKRLCPGLEKNAVDLALKNCETDHAHCVLVTSNIELQFKSRTTTENVFTGCVADAVAVPQ